MKRASTIMPRIVQLTDIHLHGDPSYFHPGNKPDARRQTVHEDGRLWNGNVNVRKSLQLIVQQVVDSELLGKGDLLILTGDLVQDFQYSTYVLLRDTIEAAFLRAWNCGLGRCSCESH